MGLQTRRKSQRRSILKKRKSGRKSVSSKSLVQKKKQLELQRAKNERRQQRQAKIARERLETVAGAHSSRSIPHVPFKRLLKEVLGDVQGEHSRITKEAVDALHESSENYLMDLMFKANILARKGNRVTISSKDIKLAAHWEDLNINTIRTVFLDNVVQSLPANVKAVYDYDFEQDTDKTYSPSDDDSEGVSVDTDEEQMNRDAVATSGRKKKTKSKRTAAKNTSAKKQKKTTPKKKATPNKPSPAEDLESDDMDDDSYISSSDDSDDIDL